jgi:hypothetical protein
MATSGSRKFGLTGYIFAFSRSNRRVLDCARTSVIQTITGGRGHFARPAQGEMA